MKKIIFILALLCLIFGTAEAKTLKVGTNATYPPFESFDKNGKIIGFDVDLMKAISKKTGYDFEFIDLPFEGLITALTSNNVDLVVSALTITADREKAVDFVEYFKTGVSILVRKNNTSINGVKDLKNGLKVGVELGSSQEQFIEKFKDVKTSTFNNVELYIALETGKVDAILMDDVPALYYLKTQKDSKLKIVGESVNKKGVGIAIPKNNKTLRKEIQKALKELKENGEYQKIQKKWID
jgi:polar amino acid transport system substrate-binding protein